MSSGQQVAPRREHLAELDEDRPERLQRLAQAHARARPAIACAGAAKRGRKRYRRKRSATCRMRARRSRCPSQAAFIARAARCASPAARARRAAARAPPRDLRSSRALARAGPLFLDRVFDQAPRRCAAPRRRARRRRRARGPGDAVRGDVAEDLRQVLLDVPAQVARTGTAPRSREARIALDVDRAQQLRPRRAPRAASAPGPERDDERRLASRALGAPRAAAVRAMVKRSAGSGGARSSTRLAGERREALARPGLGVEQVVESGGERATRRRSCETKRPPWVAFGPSIRAGSVHLLDAGELPAGRAARPAWRGSRPPRSPAARRPAPRASVPEKRTLAQCLSPSVTTSSRSALSVTTSVCCRRRRAATTSFFELLEHLVAGEFAQLLQVAAVVRDLQPDEVELRAAQEARDVEAGRDASGAARRPGCGARIPRPAKAAARRRSRCPSQARVLQRAAAPRRASARSMRTTANAANASSATSSMPTIEPAHAVGAHQPAERAAEREPAEQRRPPGESARRLRRGCGRCGRSRGSGLLRRLRRRGRAAACGRRCAARRSSASAEPARHRRRAATKAAHSSAAAIPSTAFFMTFLDDSILSAKGHAYPSL